VNISRQRVGVLRAFSRAFCSEIVQAGFVLAIGYLNNHLQTTCTRTPHHLTKTSNCLIEAKIGGILINWTQKHADLAVDLALLGIIRAQVVIYTMTCVNSDGRSGPLFYLYELRARDEDYCFLACRRVVPSHNVDISPWSTAFLGHHCVTAGRYENITAVSISKSSFP